MSIAAVPASLRPDFRVLGEAHGVAAPGIYDEPYQAALHLLAGLCFERLAGRATPYPEAGARLYFERGTLVGSEG